MTHHSTASDDYHRESAERAFRADLHEQNARFFENNSLPSPKPGYKLIRDHASGILLEVECAKFPDDPPYIPSIP